MLLNKRHFSKLALADQISALPVAFSFYMVYDLIRDMTKRNVLGFTGLITSSLLADFIKRLPRLWFEFLSVLIFSSSLSSSFVKDTIILNYMNLNSLKYLTLHLRKTINFQHDLIPI